MGIWVGGWLENWRVKLISAINKVIVEVEAEIGKNAFFDVNILIEF